MEDDELFRQRIIIVAILLLIIGPIFLYVYLERGAEDFTDWFFNGIIGLMFTGFIFIFIPTQFGKLYHKLFNKHEGWGYHFPHLLWFLFFQTEVNGTIMKKKTITFIMKGPSIFSELRFAQSQYHTKNNDSSITMGRRIADRFIGGVTSTHFSILACIDSSSMITTSCLC